MSTFPTFEVNSAPARLVFLYGGLFVSYWILSWLLPLVGFSSGLIFVFDWLALPLSIEDFLFRPWTLFTAIFLLDTDNIIGFIFRLVILFQFGNLLLTFRKDSTLWFLWIVGGLGSYLFILLVSGITSLLTYTSGIAYGPGPSMLALIAACGGLTPELELQLFLFGRVRLKWVALILVLLSLVTLGPPSLQTLAHAGGAAFGFFYAIQFRQGKDWEKMLQWRNPKRHSVSPPKKGKVSEEELDALLDKVSKRGYASLSRLEKERLEQASRQDL